MAAKILGGKQIAEAIKAEIKAEIADLGEVHAKGPRQPYRDDLSGPYVLA